MKLLMLIIFGLLIAEKKYSLRLGRVEDTSKVAVFYDTSEEDAEGNPVRKHYTLIDLNKLIKNGR